MIRAVAAQQDLAHRSRRARAAGADDRREQRRLARQRHHARPLRRADDEHAQPAQLAERDREIEVGEQASDLRAEVPLEVRRLDAGDVEAADLRQVEHAVAVDRAAVVDVDRSPDTGDDLVARADRVVGRDRDVVERLEGLGGLGEEARAEDRQQATGRAFDEALELVRPRRRRLDAAGVAGTAACRSVVDAAGGAVARWPAARSPRLSAGHGAGRYAGCRPGGGVALRIPRRRERAARVLFGGGRRRDRREQRQRKEQGQRTGPAHRERAEGRHHREEAARSAQGHVRRGCGRRW